MQSTKHISHFKKTLRIRGEKWLIKTKFALRGEDGTPYMGLCDPNTRTIYIEQDLPEDIFLETLIHEYIHAVWFECGVPDTEISMDMQHMLLNPLAKDMVAAAAFWSRLFRLG